MKTLPENSPYLDALMKLLVSINQEVGLPKEDQVLIQFQLNTKEKVIEFATWILENMKNEKLQVSPTEIMNKTAQISKKS